MSIGLGLKSIRKKGRDLGLDPEAVRHEVESAAEEILNLLDRLVSINSHSIHEAGVNEAARVAAEALPAALIPRNPPEYGEENRIWVYDRHTAANPPVLLVGHLDTVFPPGVFDGGLIDEDEYLRGPGVADMKGGVAVMIGAVRVLERLNLLNELSLTLALNGDEEIGSVRSGMILGALAHESRAGLVFESGGPNGSVVTSRRGVRRYRLEVAGPGGHAGFQLEDKQSAVVELAHQILRFESFNKPKAGISVNVGRIAGGIGTNVVPALSEADFEIRCWDDGMCDSVAERIMASLAAPSGPGFEFSLERTHARPSMPRSGQILKLFKVAAKTARRLGYTVKEEARLGASDANILIAAGLPTIDGLGPVGEMDHSPRERIIRDSLFRRTELLVHLLWNLRNWS